MSAQAVAIRPLAVAGFSGDMRLAQVVPFSRFRRQVGYRVRHHVTRHWSAYTPDVRNSAT